MKFIIVALALAACVYADVSELGYDYPAPAASAPQQSYLPPAASAPAPAASAPAPVAAPHNSYIPPAEPAASAPAPVAAPHDSYIPPAEPAASAPAPVTAPENSYIPPAASAPAPSYESPAEDGYHYKTVRRVVYRYRH